MKIYNTNIPASILDRHCAVMGMTGAGKSSKLRVLVEHLLRQEKPVCIVDPKGDWYGLKLDRTGRGPGFPVVVFGGEYADIPITDKMGAMVAEVVAVGNRSYIVDLFGLSVSARTRFFVDFAESYYRLCRGARHLVVDEVHNFAPKGAVLSPDAGKCMHAMLTIATEGRGRGITMLAASQRPQRVHNDLLDACNTLIAAQTIHTASREAVATWIKGVADKKVGDQVINSLAGLPVEQAWVWSPKLNYGPVVVDFPMFETFDSFHPDAREKETLAGSVPLDLDELKAKFASLVEVRDSKGKKGAPADLNEIKKLEQKVKQLEDANTRLQNQLSDRDVTIAGYQISQNYFRDAEKALRQIRAIATESLDDEPRAQPAMLETSKEKHGKYTLVTVGASPAPEITVSQSNNTVPQQKIIDAISWWEMVGKDKAFSKTQVAFIAGYSPKSSGFTNLLGTLRSTGKIEYPSGGMLALTELGRSGAVAYRTPTLDQLHTRVLAKLTEPQCRLMRPLLSSWPAGLPNADLAEQAGYSLTSSGFTNTRGSLRSLGLLDYQHGKVIAADFLFPF